HRMLGLRPSLSHARLGPNRSSPARIVIRDLRNTEGRATHPRFAEMFCVAQPFLAVWFCRPIVSHHRSYNCKPHTAKSRCATQLKSRTAGGTPSEAGMSFRLAGPSWVSKGRRV